MKISQDNLQASLEESLTRHHVPGASIAVFHEGELITAAAGVTHVNTGVELAETAPARLIPLGDEKFLLDSNDSLPDASRIFAFRNPDAAGRMQHLGHGMRLYPRGL